MHKFLRTPGQTLNLEGVVELNYVRTLHASRAASAPGRDQAHFKLTLARPLKVNGVRRAPSDGPLPYTLYQGESIHVEGGITFNLTKFDPKGIWLGVLAPSWMRIVRSENLS